MGKEKNRGMAGRPTGQRVAYVRVSTIEQNPARQLEAVGECDAIFTEKQSGKNIGDRPQLAALIRHVRTGDHVVVASMDRLARSLVDLNTLVQQITGDPADHAEDAPRKGATLEFVTERLVFRPGIDDPFTQFQLNLMGSMAQFERALIRQRQREGIEAAKKRGVYTGRPRALDSATIKAVRTEALEGKPKAQIARDHGISRATLYRYLETPTLPI
ncbi:recombinase family protein [Cutibacterium avidum]|uniref:recombinase family protein n=2 Tax=Cutibacterium avidum TaxID=33010 RepID=UPI002093A304